MKISPTGTPSSKRFIKPVIPLEWPVKSKLKQTNMLQFKLQSIPVDPDLITYKLSIPYFGKGTPEELLIFLDLVDKAIVGTNITDAPDKYALLRRLLKGEALSAFNNTTDKYGTKTEDNFVNVQHDLIKHIFPRQALSKQKCWMRRFLRKPATMSTREFMSRMTEINHFLDSFPDFQDNQKLPKDEIMDIVEFGVPNS